MGKNGKKQNEKVKCSHCKKEHEYVDTIRAGAGKHLGNSTVLSSNTLSVKYGFTNAHLHPFASFWTWGHNKAGKLTPITQKELKIGGKTETTDYKHRAAEAHHLICKEAMKRGWAGFCKTFGYDIDHPNNNVFLPANAQIACQLGIPLHFKNHNATYAIMIEKGKNYYKKNSNINATTEKRFYKNNTEFDLKMIVAQLQVGGHNNYVDAVIELIDPIKDLHKQKKCAEYTKDPCKELDDISTDIWNYLKKFEWTLTFDGLNYMPGKLSAASIKALEKKGNALSKEARIKLYAQKPSLGCLHTRNLSTKKAHFENLSDYYCKRCDHGYRKVKKEKNKCFKERDTYITRFTDKESFPIEKDEDAKKKKVAKYKLPSNWNK